MATFDLGKTLYDLLDRPVSVMTDDELLFWRKACDVMERKVSPAVARRDWKLCRVRADSEIARRKASSTGAH